MPDHVVVGTIGRPHGLRGQVTVRPRTDSIPERFAAGAVLIAGGRPLTVTGYHLNQGRLVVSFANVSDRTAAEELRGLDLEADGEPTPTEADEYHDSDLRGLAAVDPDGLPLGEVIDVQHHPAQDLLVVLTPIGERLVPFVAALVPEVDVPGGRLVIDPIPGLLAEAPDAD